MEAQPPPVGTGASDARDRATRDQFADSSAAEALGQRRQQVASLWAATELAQDLDMDRLAQRVVEGVTEVTDFTVATLTVRDGDTCRRVAAAGVGAPRIGLETPYANWAALLHDDYRARSSCFVIPPEASQTDWVQTVPVRRRPGTQTEREPWTEQHGLVVELLDEEGERIGFVSVDAPRSGLLPDDTELEHLELFARQAQSGLRNARLHGQVLRQRDAAEALNAVVRAVSGSLELREVLRLCCDAVVDRSVGDRASIYLHDAEAGHFRTVMSRGDMPQDPAMWAAFKARPPATPDDTPAIAEVMRTGEPLLIGEVTPEHIRAEDLALFGSRSLAVYPMRSGELLTGMLMVDTIHQHLDFPRHEVELVTQIASQAAVAIHQAQLHEAARAQGARADELYELTKQMTRTFDFDVVFERIVAAVTQRTSAYAVGLMEVVDDELVLLRANLTPDDDAPLPFERLRIAEVPAPTWRALSDEGVVSINDIRRTGVGVHALPEARSVLVAAHRDESELSLVLHVTSTRVAGFSHDDAAFVKGLVEVAALALRNARLYEEMRRTSERDGLTGLK
ncbi:MAG: GAF domain-containing protein, partial [Trueperaceae bacterium]